MPVLGHACGGDFVAELRSYAAASHAADHPLLGALSAQHLAEVPEGRRQLALGTLEALQARAAFFDQMLVLLWGEDAPEVPVS
ncbi:hypothetical protein [Polyangium aurulentum]|uniref:hypothetical protein n=1 Tax=Polyangium aurulentum TaxID=2567896 RepID=UPI0010AE9289|nr:hypothetical protein [Polyangium aurulentum]UQA60523.1 hypothetical protein E8A73_008640 [Polyangium aurulentum]